MFNNLMKAGTSMIKNKAEEVQKNKEKFLNLSDDELIFKYKKTDFSSKNLAIRSILEDRGYEYKNNSWKK